MLLVFAAHAATLPTECPTTLDGPSLAPLLASRVAPVVTESTAQIAELRDTYGDSACPAADGPACVSEQGVSWEGTLEGSVVREYVECDGYATASQEWET